ANLVGGGCQSPTLGGMDWGLGSKNAVPGLQNVADYKPKIVDQLLAAGESAISQAQQFAIYFRLYKQVPPAEPYVPLYLSNLAIAVSPKYHLSGYSGFFLYRPWPLGITKVG